MSKKNKAKIKVKAAKVAEDNTATAVTPAVNTPQEAPVIEIPANIIAEKSVDGDKTETVTEVTAVDSKENLDSDERMKDVPAETPVDTVEPANAVEVSKAPTEQGSSDEVTTPNVEPVVENKVEEDEEPIADWVDRLAKGKFIPARLTKTRDDGEPMEIFLTAGFKDGKPVYFGAKKPKVEPLPPNATPEQKAKAQELYDLEVQRQVEAMDKKKIGSAKRISRLIPEYLYLLGTQVQYWTGKKEKAQNLLGKFVGFCGDGGSGNFVVVVKDDNGNLFKKSARNIQCVPVDHSPFESFVEAKDVTAKAEQKLLTDGRKPADIKYPHGYDKVMKAIAEGTNKMVVMAVSSFNKQVVFFAQPVTITDHGKTHENYVWNGVTIDDDRALTVLKDQLPMRGSLNELIRASVVSQQDNVDNITLVSLTTDREVELLYNCMVSAYEGTDNENREKIA